jgi:hypothetical protein
MIVFRGLSNFSAVPAAVRDGAGDRAARLGRMMPVEAWCRASTLLVMRRQDDLPAARSGFTSRPPALAANHSRDDCHAFVAHLCFAAAYLVAGGGRLLLSAGFIRSRHATLALRWSCWLTERGMHTIGESQGHAKAADPLRASVRHDRARRCRGMRIVSPKRKRELFSDCTVSLTTICAQRHLLFRRSEPCPLNLPCVPACQYIALWTVRLNHTVYCHKRFSP